MSNTAQFTDKYEKTGGIGRVLVRHFLECVASIIPEDAHSMLEVGCGAGYSTAYLSAARRDARWFASDVDPELVRMARGRLPNVELAVESIYKLDREDNGVDLILAREVFEHLEDPRSALKELARATKTYAIISVPREPLWRVLNMARGAYWSALGNTPGHLNHWSTSAFRRFVELEFDVEEVRTPPPVEPHSCT